MDDLSACNHMAIDLRWCMGHDLMNVEFMDMKESICKSYGELPLFFNAETVAKVLRDAPSTACEWMHEAGFSTLKIGNGIVDPKEQFIAWVQHHTEGAVR